MYIKAQNYLYPHLFGQHIRLKGKNDSFCFAVTKPQTLKQNTETNHFQPMTGSLEVPQ